MANRLFKLMWCDGDRDCKRELRWMRASDQDHISRVIAQRDVRVMVTL